MTYLREHAAGQFLCLVTRGMIGQHFRRETADRLAGLFRRVMLRQCRSRQFLFQLRDTRAPQYDSGKMSDAVGRFLRFRSVQALLQVVMG